MIDIAQHVYARSATWRKGKCSTAAFRQCPATEFITKLD